MSTATARPKAKASHVMKRLWQYLRHERWIIITASVLSVLGNILGLLSPKLSGAAIDAIIPGAVDFPVVLRYVIAMVVVALCSSLLSWVLSAMMIRMSRNVVKRMRGDLFNHLTCLPISFFDTHQTGDVISILSYDVDTVGASLSTDLTQILASLITQGLPCDEAPVAIPAPRALDHHHRLSIERSGQHSWPAFPQALRRGHRRHHPRGR